VGIRVGVLLAAALTVAVGVAAATTGHATKATPVSFSVVYSGSGKVVKTYHLRARTDLVNNCGLQERGGTITLSKLSWRTEWKGITRSKLSSNVYAKGLGLNGIVKDQEEEQVYDPSSCPGGGSRTTIPAQTRTCTDLGPKLPSRGQGKTAATTPPFWKAVLGYAVLKELQRMDKRGELKEYRRRMQSKDYVKKRIIFMGFPLVVPVPKPKSGDSTAVNDKDFVIDMQALGFAFTSTCDGASAVLHDPSLAEQALDHVMLMRIDKPYRHTQTARFSVHKAVPCAPMRNVPANFVISYTCTVRVDIGGSVKVSGTW
jgi:hypothetical protein